jgi:hypothetical protein
MQRTLETRLAHPGLSEAAHAYITTHYERLQAITREWAHQKAVQLEVTREMLAQLRKDIREALKQADLFDEDAVTVTQ